MNVVEWALTENKTQQGGIPSRFRAVILVKHKSNDKFMATIQIAAEDGSRLESTIQNVSGRAAPTNPVIFDPQLDSISLTDFGFIHPKNLAEVI